MMFWRSVVFKLWSTFLLLISVVLIILTVMLLEYFEQYHMELTKKELTSNAAKASSILEQHPDIGMDIVWELVDESAAAAIELNGKTSISPDSEFTQDSMETALSSKQLKQVNVNGKETMQTIKLASEGTNENVEVTASGVPILQGDKPIGAVYVFQNLSVLNDTKNSTTKFIVLAAVVAIILTTIFAFFLLTRITAPLRKMREAAMELARGNFETTVPIWSQDEIGELSVAFNQMAKRLNFNINALSQEKEQLGNILSGMADGVLTFNKNGSLLITNPPAERFLQYWHYEQGSSEPLQEQVPAEVKELFQLAIGTGEEQIAEMKLSHRAWVIIVSPLYNREQIRGAIAVIRDMTEERKLDKLRNDFIANVSHELRTPISMLQGYSEAIVDNIAQSEEEKQEMAKIIYDESLRMGRLVNELLDLARMEAGHLELFLDEVEMTSFFHRVARKFNAIAKEKNIEITMDIQEDMTPFVMDVDKIEQVVTNIIDNCIRHTKDNGTVKINAKSDNVGIYLEIEDNGAGIKEEDLPYIFERFYKADKARTRGSAGTGLGLAIAKNIVEAHNGHISVTSKYGHGTTFFIFLPRNVE
ncbi:ATP-binding protein [Niallia taxi]|uniref:ATP-binding protein n=1 Tax=Niallia taxi TaxID=2499688 RepID=UPI003982D127